MKVLHTEWSDGFGGQERRVLAEMEGLSARGHDCQLVCTKESSIYSEAKKRGMSVFTMPFRKTYDVQTMWLLTQYLKKNPVDVVNTHSGVDSWIGGISAKLAKVPVLVRTRHLEFILKRSPFNFIHYLPDMYITCGETMKHSLEENSGFPPDKIISIPTGVYRRFFNIQKNNDKRKLYGLSPEHFVVTNAAILRGSKGHEITLKAARIVLDKAPDVRFLIVGDGPKRKRLEAQAKELAISDRVIFTGFLEDIGEIYSFSDMFISSSWVEGLPQSMTQAMASRLPVVVTAVGSVPEVITNEQNGLIIHPGDYEALGENILRIIADKELAGRLVKNAFELVQKKYTMEMMVDKIETLYKNLLKRKTSVEHSIHT